MKLSIIVTTYNRPDALLKVLQGLSCQTQIPYEVIVADDGSNQETSECINLFKTNAPFPLTHVWQKNKGFRAAKIRNKAILKSKGDYIILLDGDCIPEKHFIEDHNFLAEKNFFFQGKRILISKNLSDKFNHNTFNKIKIQYFFSKHISNIHHLIRIPFFPSLSIKGLTGIRSCNMGFFRNDIFAINGFNENFQGWGREDSELAVRFYKYGLKRKEHPFKAVCFHLWHKDNDRKMLAENDTILKRSINSRNYKCVNGLVKK